eukprot:TRINITY_DN1547_c1_g1_i1.p1 TRINITY_DN1547_c1_g1~~TRINITY_DN1547_c1_g1_i1.p1  ORF type:complete len:389 (-),score=92.62 TRINITY_DN1547_c1_g1_i1:49-1101(-)
MTPHPPSPLYLSYAAVAAAAHDPQRQSSALTNMPMYNTPCSSGVNYAHDLVGSYQQPLYPSTTGQPHFYHTHHHHHHHHHSLYVKQPEGWISTPVLTPSVNSPIPLQPAMTGTTNQPVGIVLGSSAGSSVATASSSGGMSVGSGGMSVARQLGIGTPMPDMPIRDNATQPEHILELESCSPPQKLVEFLKSKGATIKHLDNNQRKSIIAIFKTAATAKEVLQEVNNILDSNDSHFGDAYCCVVRPFVVNIGSGYESFTSNKSPKVNTISTATTTPPQILDLNNNNNNNCTTQERLSYPFKQSTTTTTTITTTTTTTTEDALTGISLPNTTSVSDIYHTYINNTQQRHTNN